MWILGLKIFFIPLAQSPPSAAQIRRVIIDYHWCSIALDI